MLTLWLINAAKAVINSKQVPNKQPTITEALIYSGGIAKKWQLPLVQQWLRHNSHELQKALVHLISQLWFELYVERHKIKHYPKALE